MCSKTKYLLISFFGYLLLTSCTKNADIQPQGVIKPFVVPSHFPQPHYTFENNPITAEGVALGRALFYDKQLSIDKTISCASCHFQHAAFSDPGKTVSLGVENREGRRNSPPLFNLAWNTSFMWDGGINHIEVMPIAPITDHSEMNLPITEMIARLNASNDYTLAFKKVFNKTPIDDQQALFVLTQFMSTLISATSKYDKEIKHKASYTEKELHGKELFTANCSSCHTTPLFTNHAFKNNGISISNNDLGRFEITLDSNDIGKYKVPSLRNIALTYPYMHDGRFEDLSVVIEHYSTGLATSINISEELPQEGFQFTPTEKEALLAFLQTLTDYDFITDERFGKP